MSQSATPPRKPIRRIPSTTKSSSVATDPRPSSPCKNRSKKGSTSGTRRKRRPPTKWSEEDDVLLTEAIHREREESKGGSISWQKVSMAMQGKFTSTQCHQHWYRVLHPR